MLTRKLLGLRGGVRGGCGERGVARVLRRAAGGVGAKKGFGNGLFGRLFGRSLSSTSATKGVVRKKQPITWEERLQQERDLKPSWGDGPPKVGMEQAPEELLELLFAKKKGGFVFHRETYPLRKQFLCQTYGNLLDKSVFLLIFHHNMSPTMFQEWTTKISLATKNRVKFKSAIKNGVARVACETHGGGNWAPLAAAFHSQTCIVYSMDLESVFSDFKALVSKVPKDQSVVLLGGKLETLVINHEQIVEISKLTSLADLHYQLIGTLSNAGNSLIKVLGSQGNTLVKVLDSQIPKE